MDQETSARLKVLLDDGKKRGFLYFEELGDFFPDTYMGGPELDKVLSQLERAGIVILADPNMVPDKELSEVIFSDRFDDSEIFDDPVQVYLREVAKVPLLTSEQEIQLAESIANGGTDADRAKAQLAEANLRLVVTIAQQYRVPGIHILDLIQQGNAGLMQAAGTFDPGRGYKFSTYTTFWVHRSLNGLVSTTPRIELPAHLK